MAFLPGAIRDLSLLPIAAVCKVFASLRRQIHQNLDDFDPLKHTNKPAILLLHGSGANEECFFLAKRWLRKVWDGGIFSVQYSKVWIPSNQKTIAEFSESIHYKIQQICKLTKQQEIIMIGHSMGGLVAAHYAEHHALKEGVIVPVIITMGTPWRGSPTIDWIPKKIQSQRHQQMNVNSPFVLELNRKVKLAEDNDLRLYICLQSDGDIMVPPPFALPYHHNKKQNHLDHTFEKQGHYNMCISGTLWTYVCDIISQIRNIDRPEQSKDDNNILELVEKLTEKESKEQKVVSLQAGESMVLHEKIFPYPPFTNQKYAIWKEGETEPILNHSSVKHEDVKVTSQVTREATGEGGSSDMTNTLTFMKPGTYHLKTRFLSPYSEQHESETIVHVNALWSAEEEEVERNSDEKDQESSEDETDLP